MKSSSKHLISILLVGSLFSSSALAAPLSPVHAQHAMVVSVHQLASQAGVDILRQGGNAVDAAVATGFALAVVHPQAGNLGGGGFILVRMADGTLHFLDFREQAPRAATRDMYLDANGNVIEDASLVGYKAIAVPGSVAGLTTAQRKWGKLPLSQVMAAAIKLAQEGFPLAYEDVRSLIDDKHLAKFPESRRLFQRGGDFYQLGELLRQPELARTLRRIAADPGDFYHGRLAEELAAGIKSGGGLITGADLAAYEVVERTPVRGTYRGYEIISAPPPSSGGIALIEALNILEGFDLRSMGSRSAESIHLTTEAFRRVFFDRAEFLGDPKFTQVPVAQLIDKRYAAGWRKTINPDRASPSKSLERPTKIFGELDRIAGQGVAEKFAAMREPEHTTHFSVVDAEGNAVALTTTLNDSFGSRVTVPGLGFLLNDEMDDFVAKIGVPNTYGLVEGPANSIAPLKRPLSSMTPTIVLAAPTLRTTATTRSREEPAGAGNESASGATYPAKLFLILGSPGGPRIITTVANILMGIVDYGMNIQEAVNAPRFHHQWLPDELRLEPGFSPDTMRLLKVKGHSFDSKEYWSDGECIAIDLKNGERLGAPDARNNGKAIGY